MCKIASTLVYLRCCYGFDAQYGGLSALLDLSGFDAQKGGLSALLDMASAITACHDISEPSYVSAMHGKAT